MTESKPENDTNNNTNLDDAKLVEVAKRPTEAEAMMLVAVLADENIKAVATGGFTAGFVAEAPGWVSVKTLEDDAKRAKEVLAELKAHPPQWPDSDTEA